MHDKNGKFWEIGNVRTMQFWVRVPLGNIGLNNHCRIWILMRGILKTWNTFEAKEIGLNGHFRIWILKEVFWKSWYTFEAKEIGLNGHCQIWILGEVFWKLWYFEIKIDRIKWLLPNLNPKRGILKTLIF